MTEFVGKFLNKIDKKGRVSVPALWRPKLLGEGFSGIVAQLTNGYNSVDGYSKNYLERYQDWLDKQDPLMEGNEYEATLIFGSSMLPFDREGRVLITEFEDFLLYNIYFPKRGPFFFARLGRRSAAALLARLLEPLYILSARLGLHRRDQSVQLLPPRDPCACSSRYSLLVL
mgnify:CR=1 FL=1